MYTSSIFFPARRGIGSEGGDNHGDGEELGERHPLRVRPDHHEAREREQPPVHGGEHPGQVRAASIESLGSVCPSVRPSVRLECLFIRLCFVAFRLGEDISDCLSVWFRFALVCGPLWLVVFALQTNRPSVKVGYSRRPHLTTSSFALGKLVAYRRCLYIYFEVEIVV